MAKAKDDTATTTQSVTGDVVPRNVVIVHDMIGPAHNIYQKGEVVPEDKLGHFINTVNGPLWYAWDVERLRRLGAVETSDREATDHETLAVGPVPTVPDGMNAPRGGVPVPEVSALPDNVQTVPEGDPNLSPEAQAAQEEARRLADAGASS
jgi:hypothetical protein